MTIFFSGIVFEIFEIRVIDNTINGTGLFWKSGLLGISIAAMLILFLKKISPSVYNESDRRFSIFFGLHIGLFLLIPAIISFINHKFSQDSEVCLNYDVTRKSIGGKRNESSWIFLKMNDKNDERFEVSRDFYNTVEEGKKIQLCTKTGTFGYSFVTDFKLGN